MAENLLTTPTRLPTQVCKVCHQVGHRSDVCPLPILKCVAFVDNGTLQPDMSTLRKIQAATLSKPAMSTDDAKKLLIEKLSHSIMEHREELLEALQGINPTGDVTDEQFLPVLLPLITAIAGGAISGAVGAGVAVAVQKG
ncbi:hypothetical protein HPB51_026021 [Rhipicephalus microplus]|uniref:Uncharacterized protein n=1 Tax=Rhipicephalus microplus TaxID=6941 RepID=A0A9J6EEX7_RHIMP|nr:hypothetical protein HPB51_026021 [Rhipicephalus microplus]